MRFRYSTTGPEQSEFDSLPRLPLVLRVGLSVVEALALVDSGATVNVLPYELGLKLGSVWDDRRATLRVGGSIGSQPAMPLLAMAEIGNFFPPVKLAFAWVQRPDLPMILGQTNFFMEFDVCFYRSRLEFDVRRRTAG